MSFILTLQLDTASQAHFDHLRQLHFPPDRNYIDAHITLFHTLPEEPSITCDLQAASEECSRFSLDVTGLRSLGKGVAYTLEGSELLSLHRRLATAFSDHLTPQDRQRFRPHIVVQNKVTPEAARILLQQLQATFMPMQIEVAGLSLWRYRNGPWEPAQTFPFS